MCCFYFSLLPELLEMKDVVYETYSVKFLLLEIRILHKRMIG